MEAVASCIFFVMLDHQHTSVEHQSPKHDIGGYDKSGRFHGSPASFRACSTISMVATPSRHVAHMPSPPWAMLMKSFISSRYMSSKLTVPFWNEAIFSPLTQARLLAMSTSIWPSVPTMTKRGRSEE